MHRQTPDKLWIAHFGGCANRIPLQRRAVTKHCAGPLINLGTPLVNPPLYWSSGAQCSRDWKKDKCVFSLFDPASMDRAFSPMAGKFIGSLSEVYLCAGAVFFHFVLFVWLCHWKLCKNSSSKGWPAVYLCTGAVFFHSASFVYSLSCDISREAAFFFLIWWLL